MEGEKERDREWKGPWESGSVFPRRSPRSASHSRGACLVSPGPEVPAATPIPGPTCPGRPGRACEWGSWRRGYTPPPGCPPGAAVLPRDPRQRGLEAVARQWGRAKDLESRGSKPWGARGRAWAGWGC